MRFVCNGRVYFAAQMQKFRTQDPSIQSIYLTRDGRATFVVNFEPDGTLSAHRAGTGEIINLARRHNLAELLAAFPAHFAPAQILLVDNEVDVERLPSSLDRDIQSRARGTESARVLA